MYGAVIQHLVWWITSGCYYLCGRHRQLYDRINLDLDSSFSPASISVPMAKETWTVIEPEGLPAAVDRALRVATTPPFGPVHLAVYDKMLENQQVSTEIIHGGAKSIKAGNASDEDLGKILDALDKADKPLLYVGDGV